MQWDVGVYDDQRMLLRPGKTVKRQCCYSALKGLQQLLPFPWSKVVLASSFPVSFISWTDAFSYFLHFLHYPEQMHYMEEKNNSETVQLFSCPFSPFYHFVWLFGRITMCQPWMLNVGTNFCLLFTRIAGSLCNSKSVSKCQHMGHWYFNRRLWLIIKRGGGF